MPPGDALDSRDDARDMIAAARRYLEQRAGLGEPVFVAEWTPAVAIDATMDEAVETVMHETATQTVDPGTSAAAPAVVPAAPSLDRDTPPIRAALAALSAEVAACTKCPLHKTRTNPVFGIGSCRTGIMFVGEGPGENEDLQGEPFVGRAGKFLTSAIEGGLKLTRDDVYIANIVKSRPPGNRVPTVEEADACTPYLWQQIAILRPAVIVALGLTAATWLLVPKGSKATLGSLRGRAHDYQGIPTIATYHPAAILRNPHYKRPFWEDLQMVMRIAGLPMSAGESSAS